MQIWTKKFYFTNENVHLLCLEIPKFTIFILLLIYLPLIM